MSLPPAEAERLQALIADGQLAGWPGTPLSAIGRVVAGSGLVAVASDQSRAPLPPRGYLHAFD